MDINNRLLLHTHRGIESIAIGNIIRVEALSNYCKLYVKDEKATIVAKVLRWFEDELPSDLFTRVHRSHLINMAYIDTYSYSDVATILLKDNSSITISRRKKMGVKKLLTQIKNVA